MNRKIKTIKKNILPVLGAALLLSGCGAAKEDLSAPPESTGKATAGIFSEVYATPPEVPVSADTETETAESAPPKEKQTHTPEEYAAAGVNELNSVPILMYHGIFDMTSDETEYTGGNVDEGGYNRAWDAFSKDLEKYYAEGYRCIRLTDFLDGNIDVPFGMSPVILTFDDGLHEAEIDGFSEDGTPLFKPHSALGILEAFREAHPDFQMTATFFLNQGLFGGLSSREDQEKVIRWLVDNGYDIGNHTLDHPHLPECAPEEIARQVGGLYQILDEIIPGQYVNIVALPYGQPENTNADEKYNLILEGEYPGFSYDSKAALLCGYTRQCSPFTTDYDPRNIRRIRGYDNNGEEFDIEMCFAQLNEGKRYISDGDPDTVVIRAEEEEGWFRDAGGREVIRY